MKESSFIILDAIKEVTDPVYEHRQWEATRDLTLPRRTLLNAAANAIYDYKRTFLFVHEGSYRVWPVPDVYKEFGDIDGRWISYYLMEVNGRPRYKSNSLTLERRRLLNLYFQLEHPQIWEGFKR